MERSRDYLGSRGQKEETPQQEIDTSTSDYQLISKPYPGCSFLFDTLPFDEQQTNIDPLRHMEEAQQPILEQIHSWEPGKYSNLGREENHQTR
jgi:hypothetical protein